MFSRAKTAIGKKIIGETAVWEKKTLYTLLLASARDIFFPPTETEQYSFLSLSHAPAPLSLVYLKNKSDVDRISAATTTFPLLIGKFPCSCLLSASACICRRCHLSNCLWRKCNGGRESFTIQGQLTGWAKTTQ